MVRSGGLEPPLPIGPGLSNQCVCHSATTADHHDEEGAQGGSRTHRIHEGTRLLRPLRMPVPPPGQVSGSKRGVDGAGRVWPARSASRHGDTESAWPPDERKRCTNTSRRERANALLQSEKPPPGEVPEGAFCLNQPWKVVRKPPPAAQAGSTGRPRGWSEVGYWSWRRRGSWGNLSVGCVGRQARCADFCLGAPRGAGVGALPLVERLARRALVADVAVLVRHQDDRARQHHRWRASPARETARPGPDLTWTWVWCLRSTLDSYSYI